MPRYPMCVRQYHFTASSQTSMRQNVSQPSSGTSVLLLLAVEACKGETRLPFSVSAQTEVFTCREHVCLSPSLICVLFSETKANWIQPVALLGGSSTEQVTSLKFRKSTLLWDHLLHSFTRDAKSRTRDGACLSSDQKVQTLSELLFHETR